MNDSSRFTNSDGYYTVDREFVQGEDRKQIKVPQSHGKCKRLIILCL